MCRLPGANCFFSKRITCRFSSLIGYSRKFSDHVFFAVDVDRGAPVRGCDTRGVPP